MPNNDNPPTKNLSGILGVTIAFVIAGVVWYQKQPKSRERQVTDAARSIAGIFKSDGVEVSSDLDYGELPVYAGVGKMGSALR